MTRTRTITAYGRVAGSDTDIGGPIRHFENPATAMVRLFAEAGQAVAVSAVLDVRALVTADTHEDRILFAVVPVPGEPGPVAEAAPPGPDALPRGQRFAAYGLATDPDGRVLLTEIAPGYPGAGRWHLPGGGTDTGEQPGDALIRELYEETGQVGEITELLGVTHRRNPGAVGPEGYPIDWHGVRALYRVLVPTPSQPTVTEDAGGSTAAAAWFAPAELTGLSTTEVVQWALAAPRQGSDRGR
ncbi:NUDIX domain-containing protein [Dactylosporangium sp. AC04546]|uniref:NUDIX hydrolase n=1 Tax=Dactylosporangium sp. AC04546 TaxID=2862460 RepID=UPI001EDF30CF